MANPRIVVGLMGGEGGMIVKGGRWDDRGIWLWVGRS